MQTAEGFQERLQYHLNSPIFALEQSTPLGALYRYWECRRSLESGIARDDTFNPRGDLPPDISKQISRVELGTHDLYGAIYHNHLGRTYSTEINLELRPLGEFPITDVRIETAREYEFIRRERLPRLDEITQNYFGRHRSYRRLIVPTGSVTGEVTSLWLATRLV